MRILFVTWDGPELTYLESLFLPIFAALQSKGVSFDVLQFRWGDPSRAQEIQRQCDKYGIGYRARFIHRRPAVIGPFATAVLGARHVRAAVRDYRSDVIMPRCLMPSLAVLCSGGTRFRPILFDADGLEADERADFRGISRASSIYRILRSIERTMVHQAKAVLVRTNFAARVLYERTRVKGKRFHVVSNGRDQTVFTPGSADERQEMRRQLGVAPSAPLLVYAGSIGLQYRFDQMMEFARAVHELHRGTRMLILTGSPDAARAELERHHSSSVAEFTTVMRVQPRVVPIYLAAADVAFAFRARSWSSGAVAPIKLGEYLLCGLPVIGTVAVGNTAPAIRAEVFIDETVGADAAAAWLVQHVLPRRDELRSRARAVGVEHFSLERSVDDYLRAIEDL